MDVERAMPVWQGLLAGLFGLLYVFSGYRTLRFTARMTSALLFGTIGMLAATNVAHPAAVVAIVAGAGILGFLLGNAFYFVSVSLYGAAGGVVLAAMINLLAGGRELGWAAGIGGAVAGAVLAVLFERPIGILGTSLVGGALTMKAVHSLLIANGVHAPGRYVAGYVSLVFVLGLVGCIVQAKTTKNLPPPSKEPAGQKPGVS